MKDYLLQKGLPSQIGNTFTNMCEAICEKNVSKQDTPTRHPLKKLYYDKANFHRTLYSKVLSPINGLKYL